MHGKIIAMIKNHDVCVLATVAGTEPHCSLMSYAASEDGREIYMATHKNTKKARNINNNPGVSLLIDSREADRGESRPRAKALTIAGVMEKAAPGEKSGAIRALLLERHPHLADFLAHPDADFLVFRAEKYQLLEGVAAAYYEEA